MALVPGDASGPACAGGHGQRIRKRPSTLLLAPCGVQTRPRGTADACASVCAREGAFGHVCGREQGWAPLGGHGARLRLSRCPSRRARGCGAPRDGCRAGPGGPLRSLMWLSPLLFLCPGRIWDSDSYLNRSATTPPLVRFTQKASIRTSCFTAPSTRSSSSGARAWRLSPRAPSRWSCSSECGGRARRKRTLLLPGWGGSQPFPVQPFPTAATPLRGSSPDPSQGACSSPHVTGVTLVAAGAGSPQTFEPPATTVALPRGSRGPGPGSHEWQKPRFLL